LCYYPISPIGFKGLKENNPMVAERFLKKTLPSAKNKTTSPKQNTESKKRSLAKTVSWRLIGTLDTILISWLITGKMTFALSIGAVEFFTKMILYFFHERIWNFINWGK